VLHVRDVRMFGASSKQVVWSYGRIAKHVYMWIHTVLYAYQPCSNFRQLSWVGILRSLDSQLRDLTLTHF
jgi:hypothetical protein